MPSQLSDVQKHKLIRGCFDKLEAHGITCVYIDDDALSDSDYNSYYYANCIAPTKTAKSEIRKIWRDLVHIEYDEIVGDAIGTYAMRMSDRKRSVKKRNAKRKK